MTSRVRLPPRSVGLIIRALEHEEPRLVALIEASEGEARAAAEVDLDYLVKLRSMLQLHHALQLAELQDRERRKAGDGTSAPHD